jgi:hypothetical protein
MLPQRSLTWRGSSDISQAGPTGEPGDDSASTAKELVVVVHQIRYQDLSLAPSLTALCAGYESGQWRTQALVDDVMNRHLPSFALSFTDWTNISGETAAALLRKAAQAVYSTQKYRRRGEFGELLLHAAAKDFFGAQPAISKIHFKDTPNDTVKGFDCVHVVEQGGAVELWLGEVKLYEDLASAVRDSAAELIDHLEKGYLRKEFIAITNKLDPAWQHTSVVREMLDDATSLDEILDRLVIPVMLTYNSSAIASHEGASDEYREAIREEATRAWVSFDAKFETPYPVTIHLILIPLESKEKLVNLFHQKLQVWQHI